MELEFLKADISMLDDIYDLILKRVEWMDKKGIKQWNVTNYIEFYPKDYYKKQIEENNLYVIVKMCKVVSAIVLLDEDSAWEDTKSCKAYYIHNFVTDLNEKGVGKKMLKYVEVLAKQKNKEKLRLDCASSNEFLNNYYEKEGFILVGKFIEGPYIGNKREKIL